MFLRADGMAWGVMHQRRRIEDACAAAGINIKKINFRALRHTYASHAIMNGAPLIVIAKNLGLSKTTMIERHHGHMTASLMDSAIKAAAPVFEAAA